MHQVGGEDLLGLLFEAYDQLMISFISPFSEDVP